MKKIIIIGAVVVMALAAFGWVGFVNAQTPPPPAPETPWGSGMPGMYGRGRGMHGGMWSQRPDAEEGPMHEAMEAALAEALGMTPEELEAAHAEGKTFWQLAEEKGLTVEEMQAVMLEARQQAIEKMVEEGVITREQADWMLSRMQNMWGGGFGRRGGCPGMEGGFGGQGRGRGVPPATNSNGVSF